MSVFSPEPLHPFWVVTQGEETRQQVRHMEHTDFHGLQLKEASMQQREGWHISLIYQCLRGRVIIPTNYKEDACLRYYVK